MMYVVKWRMPDGTEGFIGTLGPDRSIAANGIKYTLAEANSTAASRNAIHGPQGWSFWALTEHGDPVDADGYVTSVKTPTTTMTEHW